MEREASSVSPTRRYVEEVGVRGEKTWVDVLGANGEAD